MILYSDGDVLEAAEDIIAHQVNCQGKMNSGVARAIRNKWPSAFNDYLRFYKSADDKESLLGKILLSQVEDNKFVAHLFGQYNYGYDGERYTSYDALYDGLTYIKNLAQKFDKSIALPFKIGSDRGGADWFVVQAMLESIFADYSVHLYKLEEN